MDTTDLTPTGVVRNLIRDAIEERLQAEFDEIREWDENPRDTYIGCLGLDPKEFFFKMSDDDDNLVCHLSNGQCFVIRIDQVA